MISFRAKSKFLSRTQVILVKVMTSGVLVMGTLTSKPDPFLSKIQDTTFPPPWDFQLLYPSSDKVEQRP